MKKFSFFILTLLSVLARAQAQQQITLLKEISPGSASTSVSGFVEYDGALIFTASEATYGNEMWRTDGTEAGTMLVKDIRSGTGFASPSNFTEVNGTLFFRATDGSTGVELFKTDGTESGTVLVKDIYPGSQHSNPQNLTNVNGTLMFSAKASNANGIELWKSDGTESGTVMVKDVFPGSGSSSPQFLTELGGTVFFRASDGVSGLELWKSDGTETGTVMVKDIRSGNLSSSPGSLINSDGVLYFSANEGTNGTELWKSDGTESGTVLIKYINTGSSGSNPSYFVNVNGILYFRANDGTNGTELWKTDGTEGGTVMVKDIQPGIGSSNISYPVGAGTSLFFVADDGVNGSELWKSDGTEVGTVMVKDIGLGSTNAGISYMVNANGTLYFNANDGVSGSELWKSDGTEAGTVMVDDQPGTDFNPAFLAAFGDHVIFKANGGADTGNELYRTAIRPIWDGSTSTDWNTASNWSSDAVPTVWDNVLISTGPSNQPHITSSSGTPAVCRKLETESGAILTIDVGKAMTVGGNIVNEGTILVKADASGIGSLITEGDVSGSGSFQMEQYLTGSGGITPDGLFWYVGSPVASATSNVYNAAGTDKLWRADETTQSYPQIADNSTSLNVMEGYVARLGSNSTLTFTGGTFNNGNQSASGLTRTGTTETNRGYNLVSNPYPSTVSWDDASRTNLETTMWYRTHQGSTMLYDTYNASSGIGTNNNGNGAVTGDVPPTQAFWVRVSADGLTGQLDFTNADRSHGTLAGIYKTEAQDGLLRMTLSNGSVSDEAVVAFNSAAQDVFDDYDSHKFWAAASVPQVYMNVLQDTLAINGLYSTVTNPIVPLGVKIPASGEYSLTANDISVTGEDVYLEDRYLHFFQDLNLDADYTFTSDVGNIGDRFILHFGTSVTGVEDGASMNSRVYTSNGNQLNIILSENTNTGNVQVLDMAGRIVRTANLKASRTTLDMNTSTGIYLIRVETAKGTETHKVVIQ
ncbi:MAG: T9SS type A sorting domain-containing protein [Flavobacteriales bacterium]|nr:T9SS type A sorting domain-containing protein [Flavobacteriales bacterium]